MSSRPATLAILSAALFTCQCSAPPAPPAPNQVPTAEAGEDQQVALEQEVNLDGALSADPDGGSLSFAWRNAAENPVPVVFPEDQPSFSFVPTVAGTYIFILTVSDGIQFSDPDTVRISVASVDNHPPTADAGPDIIVGANAPVPLSALGSSDPDGHALTYRWTVVAAPAEVEMADSTALQTTFVPTASGEYRFRLEVSDGELLASVEVAVLVRATGNQVPTADAGPDRAAGAGADIGTDAGTDAGTNNDLGADDLGADDV